MRHNKANCDACNRVVMVHEKRVDCKAIRPLFDRLLICIGMPA